MGQKARCTLSAVLFLVLGCHKPSAPAASASVEGFFVPRTTQSDLALSNFQSHLNALEKKLASDPELDVSYVSQVIDQLLARAQLLGRLQDYDAAEAWLQRVDTPASAGPALFLLRAKVHGALHRFSDALLDVAQAEKARAPAKDTLPLRASLLAAQGRYDEALAASPPHRKRDLASLGAEAALQGELGNVDVADSLFDQAVHNYADVSPMPVAWIYFQRGLLHERAGEEALARKLYSVSHHVMPAYAPARLHLAQMLALEGQDGPAGDLLEPLLTSSDDPEVRAQLAALLEKVDPPRAAALRAEAKAAYGVLLERHPDAFADHAARFFLKDDPARALKWAQRNLELRQTAEAYDLALDAALAAGDAKAACVIARTAKGRPHAPPRLVQRSERVLSGCSGLDVAK